MMRFEPGFLVGTLTSKFYATTVDRECIKYNGVLRRAASTMKMLLTIRKRQMRYFDVYKQRRRGKFNT